MNEEAEIDRILQALAQTEPPPAMEDRILRRLAAEPAPRPHATLRFWRPAVALGAALAVALLLAFATHRHLPQPSAAQAVASSLSGTGPAPVQPRPAVPLQVAAIPSPLHRAARARPSGATPRPAPAAALPVSYPAPPMPLTAQEKLLLGIARRRDLNEFAQMNPEVRADLIAQSQAEFDEYFPTPKPQEIYYESHRQNP